MPKDSTESPFRAAAVFRTTHWSMIVEAGSNDSVRSAAAMEELCQRYWYPLYAYVRRRGHSHADAADLTQTFFTRLLEKSSIARVSPGTGRFRSFLLASMKNFLINEWDSANRLKRGGGTKTFSLDDSTAEELYRQEPAHHAAPDKLFDHRWAVSMLEIALARLRAEFVASERADLYDVLKPALTAEKLADPYSAVAARFGLTEGALRVAIHRLRKRLGELLRAEVAQTVEKPEDVDEELRYLLEALG